MTSAVILAAGKAERMGQPKLLMKLAGRSALERLLETAIAVCDQVVVVTGCWRSEVEGFLAGYTDTAGIRTAYNPSYEQGMFTSVQAGARAAAGSSALLIFPGDVPLVHVSTARAVLAGVAPGAALIAIPVCNGRRGHPVALAGTLLKELLKEPAEGTLRSFLERYPRETALVPVRDGDMLLDMDTPEEYERLCAAAASLSNEQEV